MQGTPPWSMDCLTTTGGKGLMPPVLKDGLDRFLPVASKHRLCLAGERWEEADEEGGRGQGQGREKERDRDRQSETCLIWFGVHKDFHGPGSEVGHMQLKTLVINFSHLGVGSALIDGCRRLDVPSPDGTVPR